MVEQSSWMLGVCTCYTLYAKLPVHNIDMITYSLFCYRFPTNQNIHTHCVLCPRAHLSNPQSANSRARLYVLLSKCVLNESFRGCQIIGNSIQYHFMLLKIQTHNENGKYCRVAFLSLALCITSSFEYCAYKNVGCLFGWKPKKQKTKRIQRMPTTKRSNFLFFISVPLIPLKEQEQKQKWIRKKSAFFEANSTDNGNILYFNINGIS